ncbi:hypothetical protein L2E82_40658 [Cichorium intybus]|uniref:Uncharacterized protein n=1 Tax=Cichorium intybus TaxID=13427 RepID=A0ACB9ALZ7_CICIN|nr:hypothetical protein L2E82_40658 [Cichorium intybus]
MIAREGVGNIRTIATFNELDKILSLFSDELRVPQKQRLRRSQISGVSQLALFASEALIIRGGEAIGNVFSILDSNHD